MRLGGSPSGPEPENRPVRLNSPVRPTNGTTEPSRVNRLSLKRVRGAALLVGVLALAGCVSTQDTGDAAPSASPIAGLATGLGSEPRATRSGNYLKARHADRVRDVGTASTSYGRVLSDDPDNISLQRRTFLASLENGDFETALDLAARINRNNVISSTAAVLETLSALKADDPDEAAKILQGLSETRLDQILGHLIGAWIDVAREDLPGAAERLDAVRELSGFEALADLHEAYIASMLGDVARADRLFASAKSRNPRVPLRLSLAESVHYATSGRLDSARSIMDERASRDFDAVAVDRVLDEAADGLPTSLAVRVPSDGAAEALFDLASALQRDRGSDLAMAHARMALYLRPNFPLASLLVAEILDDRRRYADAIAVYNGVAQSSPYHYMSQLRKASGLESLERDRDAATLLESLASLREDDPAPMIRLGDLHRQNENWDDAIVAYDAAIERLGEPATSDWSLFYSRGIALERAKIWDRAEGDFLKALKLRPEQPYVLNYLGYSWVEQGRRLDEAQEMIERAVELRPRDGYIVDSLGWVLYRTGQFDDAVTHLERAVELRPEDPTINDHLGDAYWMVGRRVEARFQWRRALSLDPEPDLASTIEKKLVDGLTEGDVDTSRLERRGAEDYRTSDADDRSSRT